MVTDQLVLLQHRDHDKGPNTSELDRLRRSLIAFEVRLISGEVCNVNDASRPHHAPRRRIQARSKRPTPTSLGEHWRRIVHRGQAKEIAVAQIQVPEVGGANTRRLFENRPKHGREIARQAGDDAE